MAFEMAPPIPKADSSNPEIAAAATPSATVNRELFEGEVVLFQASPLTITNMRVWEYAKSGENLHVRSTLLSNVTEVQLGIQRPLGILFSCLSWGVIFLAAAAFAPAHMFFWNLSFMKFASFLFSICLFGGGFIAYFAGTKMQLRLKSKSFQGAEFQVALQGIKIAPEKLTTTIHAIERAIAQNGHSVQTVTAVKTAAPSKKAA